MPPNLIRILLLGADPVCADSMLQELRLTGFSPECTRVENEWEYADRLNEQWDIIFTDARLPNFSFARALKMVRDRELETPVIPIFDSKNTDLLRSTVHLGADDALFVGEFGRLGIMAARALGRKRLRKSEEDYRFLFEENPSPMVIFSTGSLAILGVNRAALAIYGYSREEFLALTIKDIYPAEHIPAMLAWVAEVISKNKQGISALVDAVSHPPRGGWKHVKKDGTVFDVEIAGRQSLMFGGQSAVLSVVTDITERKRTEAALRQSEEKFRAVFEGSHDAIMLYSDSGCFDCNPAALEQFRCKSKEDLLGLQPNELAPPTQADGSDSAKAVNEHRERAFATGCVFFEWVRKRFDGTLLNVEVMLSRLDRDGRAVISVARDISRRKAGQELLRRLSRAIEQSPTAVVITDIGGKIEYVNPKFTETTGYTSEEVIGKNPRILKSGEQTVEFYEALWNTITSGKEWRGEFRNKKKNGDLYWESASISPVVDNRGTVTHFVAIKDDITRRKEVAEELKTQAGLINSLLDSIPDKIFFKDLNGVFLGCNPAFAELIGRPRAEIIGKSAHDFFDKESADFFIEQDRVMLELGKPRRNEEWHTYPDGRRILSDTLKTPYWGPDGKLIGILGISRDITESKRTEEALRESERNFRSFFETITDLIAVATPEGQILFANNAVERTLGYRADELAQMHAMDVFPADQRSEAESVFAAICRGERERFLLPLVTKNGKIFPAEVRGWRGLWNGIDCVFGVAKDLSAEQEAQQRFEHLFRHNPAAMTLSIMPERRFTDVNESFVRMLGYSSSELIGKTADELGFFAHPGQQVLVLEKLVAKGSITDIELQVRHKNGAILDVIFSGEVLKNHGLEHLLTVTIDVTDRTRIEAQLRKLSSAVEQSPVIVVITDSAGVIEYVNPMFVKATGYSLEEALGQNPRILKSGKHPAAYYQEMWKTISEGKVWAGELCNRKKSGELYWEQAAISPVRNSQGAITNYVAIKEDITKRRLMEERVRRDEARFRSVSNVLQYRGETTQDFLDFALASAIELSESTLGYIYLYSETRKEFMLNTWSKQAMAECRVENPPATYELDNTGIWGEAVRQRRPIVINDFEADSPLKKGFPKGHITPRRFLGVPIFNDEKIVAVAGVANKEFDYDKEDVEQLQLLMGAVWKVVEQRRAEEGLKRNAEELLQAKVEAEAANRAKSAFLANMSHEIRTPLNAILGFSQVMLHDSTLSEDQDMHLKIINRSGEHLLDLINNILDISKIEAGRSALNRVAFDLKGMLEEMEQMFQLRANAKDLGFRVECQEDIGVTLLADAGKLRQVIINLLGNAIKFTEAGGVVLRAGVTEGKETQLRLWVEIEDTGSGISEEDCAKLFQPFVQTENGSKMEEGTGLGLALSKQFLHLMEGEITVHSEVGQGSVFSFTMPVEKAEVGQIGLQKDAGRRVLRLKAACEPRRILIVDDVDSNRLLLRQMLQPVGFEFREAVNGAEAVKEAARWQPHLILMDMRMPVMNGEAAIRRIHAGRKNLGVKIVAISASVYEDDREVWMSVGVDDYIVKPFRESDLFAKIGVLLGVQYEYEQGGNVEEAEPLLSVDLQRQAVARLPRELLDAVRTAVFTGNQNRLIQEIERVVEHNAALARSLRVLAERYAYEALGELLSSTDPTL